jgi:uncharacterized phage-associated protein
MAESDTAKLIEATSVLLGCESNDHAMEYIRLLKLLYLADRELIKRTGQRMFSSERCVAMKHGPLHSRVLDLIKYQDPDSQEWQRYFTTDNYHVVRDSPASNHHLSPFEIEVLREIHRCHEHIGTWELVEQTHELLEWKKNYPNPAEKTSRVIPVEDIAEGVGVDAVYVKNMSEAADAFDRMFG